MLLFEILSGKAPFEELRNMDVVIEVTNNKKHVPIPKNASRTVAAIMQACFQYEPQLRPSFQLIVSELKLY